uniref:BTB domain-containing protein n=1 Tax=Panagrolaimus sp. PS1159 TaxID=55785 RepID=A0AC35G2F6_9BILA
MLAPVSDVFKRMISDIWNKKETIEITTNSYNDFYEFLTFLYSGNCKLNDENIFSMVDLSEFYHVKELQQKCDEYLSQIEYTKENIPFCLETLSKYYLPLSEKILSKAMIKNGINLVESDEFLETSKSIVEKIVRLEDRFVSEEKLFEKIYEWAENRVKKKQAESIDQNIILNNEIKSELAAIVPFIKFKEMALNFLHKFVVKRGFLFSYDELSKILDFVYYNDVLGNSFLVKVKITNSNGESISCMRTQIDSDIVKNIKSLKNRPADISSGQWISWRESKIRCPSTPSQIEIRDGIEWYLCCWNGGIGVTSSTVSRYVLAEMIPETSGFKITKNCKIEIE